MTMLQKHLYLIHMVMDESLTVKEVEIANQLIDDCHALNQDVPDYVAAIAAANVETLDNGYVATLVLGLMVETWQENTSSL